MLFQTDTKFSGKESIRKLNFLYLYLWLLKFITIFSRFNIQTVLFPWKTSALFRKLTWLHPSKTLPLVSAPRWQCKFFYLLRDTEIQIILFMMLITSHLLLQLFINMVNTLFVYYNKDTYSERLGY